MAARLAPKLILAALLLCAVFVPGATAGCGCWSIASTPIWRPDGSSLLYSWSGSGDSGAVLEAPVVSAKPLNAGGWTGKHVGIPAWSPDGSRLVYWRGGVAEPGGPSSIWVSDPDGAHDHVVFADVAGAAQRLSWLPDGRRVAFAANDGSVRLLDVDSGAQVRLAVGTRPLASPDGAWVAFERDRRLWVVRADGSGERQLTSAGGLGDTIGAWSPDSRRLAFTRQLVDTNTTLERARIRSVLAVDVASGATTVLSDDGRDPAWSADGSRLAYAGRGIVVADADGSNARLLTDHAYRDGAPAWSPDGKSIAFTGPDYGGSEVFLIRAEGGDLHNVTGSCIVTPRDAYGYICLDLGTTSVPFASTAGPLAIRLYQHRGVKTIWQDSCHCFSVAIAVRDDHGSRVRGLLVRATGASAGLVTTSRSGGPTTEFGLWRATLRATPKLRGLHPRSLAVRITVAEPGGKLRGRATFRLALPPS